MELLEENFEKEPIYYKHLAITPEIRDVFQMLLEKETEKRNREKPLTHNQFLTLLINLWIKSKQDEEAK